MKRRDVIGSGVAGVAASWVAGGSAAGLASGAKTGTRSWTIGSQRGVTSLALVNRELPAPGPGLALVRTRAAALNHRDLMVVESRYGRAKPVDRVPLGDGAGVVVALGPATGAQLSVAVGDRVTAAHFVRWLDGAFRPDVFEQDLGNSADGWASEHVLLPAAALVRIPDSVGDAEAAALGAAGITAWTVIEALGRTKPGDVVLTLGTGGVAILALQIARMFGARVAITSSSDEKLAVARRLGADVVVNYRKTPNWAEHVLAATGGRGVDVVVETVGLGTLDQSAACCAPNARIGLLGGLAGPPEGGAAKPWGALIARNLTIKGITSGSRAQLDELLRAAAANGLRPHVDRTFPFTELPAAYRYLADGAHVGKVLVSFG